MSRKFNIGKQNMLGEAVYYPLRRLPAVVLDVMKNTGAILAGGFIRDAIAGNDINDVDLFGNNQDHCLRIVKAFEDNGYIIAYKSTNAVTLRKPGGIEVQVITRWVFGTIDDCQNSFDFSVCKSALTVNIDCVVESVCDPRFFSDLASKNLFYTQPSRNEDVGGSLLRVLKFVKRGYHISPEELAKTISRMLTSVRFTPEVLADDKFRAQVITSVLREVDPQLVEIQ